MKANELLQSYADGLRDFSEAELASLSLVGARLCHINLEAAILNDVNLVKADLFNARLSKVRFARANLSKADLGEANLREANLQGANLRGANLRGATLINANLSETDLSDACLSGAKLSGVNLMGAKLTNANLRSASLNKAKLIKTDFTNADLSRANLYQAIFSSVKLQNTILFDATMPNGKYFSPPDLYMVEDNDNVNNSNALKLNTSELLQLEASIQDAVAILYWNIPRKENTNLVKIRDTIMQQLRKYINLKISLFNSLEQ